MERLPGLDLLDIAFWVDPVAVKPMIELFRRVVFQVHPVAVPMAQL